MRTAVPSSVDLETMTAAVVRSQDLDAEVELVVHVTAEECVRQIVQLSFKGNVQRTPIRSISRAVSCSSNELTEASILRSVNLSDQAISFSIIGSALNPIRR